MFSTASEQNPVTHILPIQIDNMRSQNDEFIPNGYEYQEVFLLFVMHRESVCQRITFIFKKKICAEKINALKTRKLECISVSKFLVCNYQNKKNA